MNPSRAIFLGFVLSFSLPAFAADVGIEFSGVMGGEKDRRVALTNKAGGGTTQWVAVGGRFAGYTVSSYDAGSEVVVLAKDGREFRLSLKSSTAKGGGAASRPPPQVERAIMNNLRQLAAAADQFYLENGKASTTYDELVGPTKYVKAIHALDGENYRAIQFAQGRPLVVTTSSGHSVTYKP